MKKILTILAIAAASLAGANAQVLITSANQNYSQSFDGLPSSGTANVWTDNTSIAGWYATAEDLADGYPADNGTSNGGDLYSYGAKSSSDRSLGYLGSGSNDYTNFALRLVNNSGSTLTGFSISFTGEQWRSGGNTSDNLNKLAFSYQVFAAGAGLLPSSTVQTGWTLNASLDFSAPQQNLAAGALDGNAAINQQSFSGIAVSGLTWSAGQELWIRWAGSDGSGTDAGLAIDDLSVTVVPEPKTWALIGLGSAFMMWNLRRKRRIEG